MLDLVTQFLALDISDIPCVLSIFIIQKWFFFEKMYIVFADIPARQFFVFP